MPVWAALLFAGTLTYQPSPKTHLADWSRYVNIPQLLASHLVASILGAGIGALGQTHCAGSALEEIRSRIGTTASRDAAIGLEQGRISHSW